MPLKLHPVTFVFRSCYITAYQHYTSHSLSAIRSVDTKTLWSSSPAAFQRDWNPIDQSVQTCPGPFPQCIMALLVGAKILTTQTSLLLLPVSLWLAAGEIFLEYPNPFEEKRRAEPVPLPPPFLTLPPPHFQTTSPTCFFHFCLLLLYYQLQLCFNGFQSISDWRSLLYTYRS